MLSLDPRIRRTGVACFEGLLLIDWGIRALKGGLPPAVATKRTIITAMALLDRYSPEILLVPRVGRDGVRRSKHVRDILQAVVKEARRRGIVVQMVTTREVKETLAAKSGERPANKQETSRILTERYPELKPRLLRARRLYDPEQYHAPLIDAVGMFLAWRGSGEKTEPERPGETA